MSGRAIDGVIESVQTLAVSPRVAPDLIVSGGRGTHDRSDFLLVRVRTSAGVEGIGEISGTLLWSGEDAVTAEHLVRTALAPAIIGRPLLPVADLEARMDRAVARSPFTKTGLSTALWDAVGRTFDVPMAVVLGGPLRREVRVKMSLSGDGDRLRSSHRAATAAGFAAFKVKVGLDPDGDASRFAAARELVGQQVVLGVDANGGWSRSDARRALRLLEPYHPTFIEQPLAPGDLIGMRELRAFGLPVIADESVFDLDDLVALIHADAADIISVYVGKSGGPGRALTLARTAHAFGLETVIGSNGELGVGAAAQLHVASAVPGLSTAIPSDIIGAHYYEEDILAEPLDVDGRQARLPDGPGLGVRLRDDIADRFR